MKLADESQILDKAFRLKVIEEITGAENIGRKQKALRAHEILKDKTKKWVIEMLSREFEKQTVIQMVNRAANVSILKKVANKLARAYADGVDRTVYLGIEDGADYNPEQGRAKDEKATRIVQELAEELMFNHQMKKVDRYLYPHRNALLLVLPEKNTRESVLGVEKYDLCLRALAPHLYDVIPDAFNPEKARVLILTDFTESTANAIPDAVYADGKTVRSSLVLEEGDGKEQMIANSPADKGREDREFIWWSDNYHFTTDKKGEIISDPNKTPEGLVNPIGRIPGEFFAVDQDGSFWAEGGDDLVDGALMINVELTDLYTIKNVQGWGQPVLVSGKIDQEYKGGPHRLIKLKAEKGDPEPSFQYVSSNPPLDQHMRSIEMSTALYLSTNNLSPSNVSGKLDATTFPSGIAQMVENAQSTEPVLDRQKYFKDKEPKIWELIRLWQERYFLSGNLTDKFTKIGLLPSSEVELTFQCPKPIITEKEHLENLKARKDLGINTMLDLIKMDNPELTDQQAQERLDAVEKEKKANAAAFGIPNQNPNGTELGNSQNDQNPKPPPPNQDKGVQGNA